MLDSDIKGLYQRVRSFAAEHSIVWAIPNNPRNFQPTGSLAFGVKEQAMESTQPIRSHYDYLERTIAAFGQLVFGKPNGDHFNEGYIDAHGDKCYSYMSDAEAEHGISRYRFAMLYLLTYTSLLDRPKHESYDWVVTNYAKYVSLLRAAEEEAGIHQLYADADALYAANQTTAAAN